MQPTLDKAFVSFRVGTPQWMPPERFQELLRWFQKYPGLTDEIALFTSETHPPLSLPVLAERAALMRMRLRAARAAGFRAGINILATIGHHEENLANSLKGDFTPLTDSRGQISRGAFCPNDDRLRDYIRQLYQLIVSAEPDFIWIDDDLRLFGHKPIIETCFCDHCLELFAEESGQRPTRESLRRSFMEGPEEQRLAARLAWIEHLRRTMVRLLELIENTVHSLKPGLPLGQMNGDNFYQGHDFDRWAEVLAGPNRVPVMWRPGGGFYCDDSLRELVSKAHAIGRQIALLPETVASIQSEIENFPYQRLKKAVRTTTVEAAVHMAAGCTGAAFNVLSMYNEPLDEYEPLLRQLHAARPFYSLLARELGRAHPRGIHTGWRKNSFAVVNLDKDNWFDPEFWRMMGEYAVEVFELGLPACYAPAEAAVTLFTGDAPLAWKREDLERVLAGGVYLDAPALQRLNRMGYAHLTGFEIERWIAADTLEVFTDDPLNGAFAGRRRDGRQSFWDSRAAMLKPRAASARTLARAVNYADEALGDCCMGVFENERGGRVCVAGYYPWLFLQNLSKSSQIKAVMRWLSKDSLLAHIDSFHKINLWVREPEPGKLAVVALNSCLDPVQDVVLMLRTTGEEIRLFDMRCSETRVRSAGSDGACRKFVLPPIDPWQMRLILAGP